MGAQMLLRHEEFRRLCRARDLLRELDEPSLSVGHVAREVQISPFHFIRQFEAVFGETPSAYQRRVRRMVQVPGVVPAALGPGCLSLMSLLPASAFTAPVRSFREA